MIAKRLNLNNSNSSKRPSSDPNRNKRPTKKMEKILVGKRAMSVLPLKKVDDSDIVETIEIDHSQLPTGRYHPVGFETRQVFDIDISRLFTEYRAQVLADDNGNRFVATFAEGVTRAVQYGSAIKPHAIYMSQFQLIPRNRIEDYFADQMQTPVSEGSLFKFNKQAFNVLKAFENQAKSQLRSSAVAHADESGINIHAKRHRLHCVSNNNWTLFYPHEKRGFDAMLDIPVLPELKGILCHDHWKPY